MMLYRVATLVRQVGEVDENDQTEHETSLITSSMYPGG